MNTLNKIVTLRGDIAHNLEVTPTHIMGDVAGKECVWFANGITDIFEPCDYDIVYDAESVEKFKKYFNVAYIGLPWWVEYQLNYRFLKALPIQPIKFDWIVREFHFDFQKDGFVRNYQFNDLIKLILKNNEHHPVDCQLVYIPTTKMWYLGTKN